mmetsp:Transcript_49937/g.99115  ORF Transcript_49937/g.99115 Transcript_49937/m.99115 type:complete len:617 (+) Transcript_49937:130-1980(+)|eukprot:CAMPEP_0172691632 /NCGR_PEP_ID=MMETSP1074-20121228/24689_1 /TAXON_ID=2916 /ORGANISM="Ceratium fusus, Strain PA161109" /LENGTH=616 /DNA_ID=CAMNT_0013511729 /DNA_START=42 /DNA_END=1892 /DNA_ORIENTATION=+
MWPTTIAAAAHAPQHRVVLLIFWQLAELVPGAGGRSFLWQRGSSNFFQQQDIKHMAAQAHGLTQQVLTNRTAKYFDHHLHHQAKARSLELRVVTNGTKRRSQHWLHQASTLKHGAHSDTEANISGSSQHQASGTALMNGWYMAFNFLGQSRHRSRNEVVAQPNQPRVAGQLQDSLMAWLLGWLLFALALPILWINESRSARLETLLRRGVEQCKTLDGDVVADHTKESRDWLVHIKGEPMRSCARTADPQFNVAFDHDCLRLRSTVEVFQVVEHERTEEKDSHTGSKESVTSIGYTEEWSSVWHDSSQYRHRSNENTKPRGLQVGVDIQNCERVEFGKSFVLTEELVSQCDNFINAAPRLTAEAVPRLGDYVQLQKAACTFTREWDGLYYYRRDGDYLREKPMVGDVRVSFEYVPDGPATVMALRVERKTDIRDSFLPFRLIGRGICGIPKDAEKRALREVGEKTRTELGEDSLFANCFCCCCNLVNAAYSGMHMPEIYFLSPGSMDRDACLRSIQAQGSGMTWTLRFVGWLLLFIGLFLMLSPFMVFFGDLPKLGSTLRTLGGLLIWFVCATLTAVMAFLIISLAHITYNPAQAVKCLALASAIAVAPVVALGAL